MNPALHLVADQADRAHARAQRTHGLARSHVASALLLATAHPGHYESARVMLLNLQALEHETNELRRLLREQAAG